VRTAVTIGGNINNINISNNCAAVHAVGIEYFAYSTTIITNPDNSTTTSPRLTSELGNALISNNNFKSAVQGTLLWEYQ
jgi:hypothetical protein